MINNFSDYLQIHRMIDNIEPEFPIISDEQNALKYLYFIDKTLSNSSAVYNIIDYELLIYLELFFQKNEKIQQLITNIKSNIYHDFIIKHKYVKRLTDDLCKYNLSKLFYESPSYDPLGIPWEDNNEKI